MFSLGNEKVGMFVAITRLKDFVRPPLVDTPAKASAKRKIVDLVGKALAMEERTLGEFVDIDTLMHRVDECSNERAGGSHVLTATANCRSPWRAGLPT